ncbi:MAG: SLOG family protein [Treponema sp.]|nr:SLOG family protein [Treponema sp.]
MNFTNVTILEGEPRGVDRIAKEWAIAHNISVKEYPPDVQHNLHNVACHKRNEDMILAVEKYGAIKGFSKGIKRILRCHKPKEELIILRVGGKSANSSN